MKKHKHNWRVSSWCGKNITFSCACKDVVTRKMTKEEIKYHRQEWGYIRKKAIPNAESQPHIHAIWHDFMKKFRGVNGSEYGWKKTGHALICQVEKWAEKYPGEVTISRCDDDYYCGSIIVLIDHKSEDCYHGVSMVYIPQCYGEPSVCFLYPYHSVMLIKNLQDIQKRSKVTKIKSKQKAKVKAVFWKKAKPQINIA